MRNIVFYISAFYYVALNIKNVCCTFLMYVLINMGVLAHEN